MKVLQNGKEVKDAQVFYEANGNPSYVAIDGVNYDASAFEFKEDKDQKRTKAPSSSKESGVMTTGDLKKK